MDPLRAPPPGSAPSAAVVDSVSVEAVDSPALVELEAREAVSVAVATVRVATAPRQS